MTARDPLPWSDVAVDPVYNAGGAATFVPMRDED